MPKIINHGNTYHEIECPNCKCHFGYLNSEVEVIEDETFNNWSERYNIKCPECESSINLKTIINGKITSNGENIFKFFVKGQREASEDLC